MAHITSLPTTVSHVRIRTLGRPIEVHSHATAYSSSALSGAQRSQAEQCGRVRQRTHPAPFRARRAVGSRTRVNASCSNQVGRAVPSCAAAYASSALSVAQSSRQPRTNELVKRGDGSNEAATTDTLEHCASRTWRRKIHDCLANYIGATA